MPFELFGHYIYILNRLIFFGGYGYLPEDKVLGTFEFDETSFWVSEVLCLHVVSTEC